jgi:myo-inositol-1-phosphate synthase
MRRYPPSQTFVVSKSRPVNVAKALKRSGAEVLLNYLPVGSQRATEAYASACLEAGVSLLNCIPVFIASDRRWASRFAARGIPLVGDDVKGQVGATGRSRSCSSNAAPPSTGPTSSMSAATPTF